MNSNMTKKEMNQKAIELMERIKELRKSIGTFNQYLKFKGYTPTEQQIKDMNGIRERVANLESVYAEFVYPYFNMKITKSVMVDCATDFMIIYNDYVSLSTHMSKLRWTIKREMKATEQTQEQTTQEEQTQEEQTEEPQAETFTTENKTLANEVFGTLKPIIEQRSTQYGFQKYSKSHTVVISTDERQFELGITLETLNVNGVETDCLTLYHHDFKVQKEITVNANDFTKVYLCDDCENNFPLSEQQIKEFLRLAKYRMQFLDELSKVEFVKVENPIIENALIHLENIADSTKIRTRNSKVFYIEKLKFTIRYDVIEGDETLWMKAFEKMDNDIYAPITERKNYSCMMDLLDTINKICMENLSENSKELERLKMVHFLQWNDRNGSYTDGDLAIMDCLPMSYDDAKHSTMILFNIDSVLEKFNNEFECNENSLQEIMKNNGTEKSTKERLEKLLQLPFYSYDTYRTL